MVILAAIVWDFSPNVMYYLKSASPANVELKAVTTAIDAIRALTSPLV